MKKKDKNLLPKPNTEYIYNFDKVWDKSKDFMDQQCNANGGDIVENVVLDERIGMYRFNFKNDTTKYTCRYGWVFIENTEENQKLYKQYNYELEVLQKQEDKIKDLRKQMGELYVY